MKIALFIIKYNWPYFSVVRSIYERLPQVAKVTTVMVPKAVKARAHWDPNKALKGINPDVILYIGSKLKVPDTEIPLAVWALSDPKNYTQAVADRVDLYVSSSDKTAKLSKGVYLPPFADRRYFTPKTLPTNYPVVFVGTGRHKDMPKERPRMVNRLRESGLQVVTWGYHWPKHADARNPISGDALVRAYSQAKVALDLTRTDTNIGCRIFQASMCGTPIITRRRPDVQALLKEDTEALYYDNDFELIGKIHYYLKRPKVLQEMGQRARKRCLAEHDIDHRLAVLMTHLEALVA